MDSCCLAPKPACLSNSEGWLVTSPAWTSSWRQFSKNEHAPRTHDLSSQTPHQNLSHSPRDPKRPRSPFQLYWDAGDTRHRGSRFSFGQKWRFSVCFQFLEIPQFPVSKYFLCFKRASECTRNTARDSPPMPAGMTHRGPSLHSFPEWSARQAGCQLCLTFAIFNNTVLLKLPSQITKSFFATLILRGLCYTDLAYCSSVWFWFRGHFSYDYQVYK